MERTTLTERLLRAETEIKAGRPEQALAYCQELQTAYPRALRVQRVLGEIYLALRRPREALAALDRALAGDPEDVRACCARALVQQMHGDAVSALAWYRRACDLRPGDQALRATYRDLARRLGEPPYRPSRAGLARLYLRGDLYAHAIREWEQLVAESPDMLDAQVGLAETLWLAGHATAAAERCHRILANAPSCVKAMLIQMALALAEGDMDTASAHLQRTLQLDPDRTIAQGCFADALASGDPVMTALLRGASPLADATHAADAPMPMGRPTVGFAQSQPLAGQRNLSRPLVTSAPVESAFAVAPTSQPLPPPPPRPDVPVASQPTEVTRAFKETAFMIWGQDDDSQPRITAQRPAADLDPTAPPVLRELGGIMNDTEKRQALNWYNWLQAQGAVALGATAPAPAAEQTRSATIPIPAAHDVGEDVTGSAAGAAPGASALPAMSPTMPPPMPTAPAPTAKYTMPLPPFAPQPAAPETAPLPSSDALRTMFAELGGDTAAQPVVEPDHTPALWPARPAAPEDVESVQDSYGATRDAGLDDGTDDEPATMGLADDQGGAETYSGQQPETIEDLERQFAASGFTQIEPHPGMLAEIAQEQHAAEGADSSAAHAQPAADSAPIAEAADAVEAPAPVAPVTESGPAPRDYPARLAQARRRRDDGQLDEALNEYRVIIKNAPDLLPEVLSDLRASLAETPDHPTLHSVLGDALIGQGEYEAALESFNRATELAQARSGRT